MTRPTATLAGTPLVLGIDAGGTMTDTFIIDELGNFLVGKAATTPEDESVGFMESVDDALSYGDGLTPEAMFGELGVTLYAGTAMLNTLLSRTGQRIGLLVTKGFEDMLHQGRGVQVYTEYSYSDRLHAATHVHPEPLVPQTRIRGCTERIDVFGDVAIPLYDHEVEAEAAALLDLDVEALCVCFLMSYINPAHEQRAGEIAEALVRERGLDVPVYLSSVVRPVMREVSRLNSTLFEAYAAAPARHHLHRIEEAIEAKGFPHPLQVMLSYGGLANIRYPRLHETVVSGPVGGLLGAQYVGGIIGAENVVVTDLGGTSFDLGAVTQGRAPIDAEPTLARFLLNLPTLALESIGAGTGTIVKVDPATQKVELGPESAGSTPGPVCFDQGGTRATITDCDLILGYLNPDNFLGGKVKLNVEKAKAAVKEQITDPIGVDLYEGAEGIVRLLETEAREAIRRVVSARGFDVQEHTLMAYGGAGPLHMAGYSRGLGFADVLTFPFAAAFSAFGCTAADYLHRYTRSIHLTIDPDADDATKTAVAAEIDGAWSELADAARSAMEEEGRELDELELVPLAMLRYTGQLVDVEVVPPRNPLTDAEGLDALISAWEEEYERINRRVSRHPEAGHSVYELGVVARVPKVKPRLDRHALVGKQPSAAARLGRRDVYWAGEWTDAQILDMQALQPGNQVEGPAIIEHPATTFVIPPGFRTELDEWNIFHLLEES